MNIKRKTIVCFGDSNTHGYNSANRGRFTQKERWTCLLQEYLGEEYQVIEEGLNGRTTVFEDPLAEGLCGITYLHPCLMSHKPVDLLIIMLGTNDIKRHFAASPEVVAKGMERLVRKAQSTTEAFAPDGKILIVAPAPVEKGYENTFVASEMGENCVERSRQLAPLYQEVAAGLGCEFLDAGSIEGVEMYPYDYMHLSLSAHQKLAEKMAEVIRGLQR